MCVCVILSSHSYLISTLFYLILSLRGRILAFTIHNVYLYALSNFKIVLLYSNEKQTYWLEFKIYLCVIHIYGEGNVIPLQYSCLENPMDGGAW